MLFDYVLTIEDEIELIWRRPMGMSFVIFFTNRVLQGPLVLIDSIMTVVSTTVSITYYSTGLLTLTRAPRRELLPGPLAHRYFSYTACRCVKGLTLDALYAMLPYPINAGTCPDSVTGNFKLRECSLLRLACVRGV